MTTSSKRMYSDLPIPPGEVLEEELEAIGMTQKELAARLDRPPQVVNEIIRGKKAITPETAFELEKVLGIPAQFWVNLEAAYRITLARNKDREELVRSEEWLKAFPVREMEKRGWIPVGEDKIEKLRNILSFLGVAHPAAYREAVVGFRMTEAAASKVSLEALAAWLRRGELEARDAETTPFNAERFREALREIRGMTRQAPEEFHDRLVALCAEAGVVVRVVQELPKSGANGATRWLSEDKALIQMSLRNRWQDVFWFAFFHEAGHLLLHRTTRTFIEGVDGADDRLEQEANRFAANLLIPERDWAAFVGAGQFKARAVQEFADLQGIASGIVVGRLQHEKRLPPHA
ncbi:MAG: HigA family addiction module antitoxin, partial [Dehalococcoidia bacterium]